ncbi:MAG: invasion associated locus B family protein [Marivibrio sp.]|uniref:invasion associated locus B family protein n=1 Tax=Marivibrio sp. TaxID=2039719 RepID=UPI0032EABD30
MRGVSGSGRPAPKAIRRGLRRIAAAALAAAALSGAGAPAAADEVLGQFQDWTAHTYTQDGAKMCSMYSKPKRDEGDYTRRGDIWGFVIHRPADDRIGEVSFAMGYPTKQGAPVEVEIGSQTFQLFTDGEGAFARPEDDPQLVRAMRAGLEMVVRGVSARGTRTKDTYSLRGFTNANNAINRACGVN